MNEFEKIRAEIIEMKKLRPESVLIPLPCPFCNGKMERHTPENEEPFWEHENIDKPCPISTLCIWNDQVEAWNIRVESKGAHSEIQASEICTTCFYYKSDDCPLKNLLIDGFVLECKNRLHFKREVCPRTRNVCSFWNLNSDAKCHYQAQLCGVAYAKCYQEPDMNEVSKAMDAEHEAGINI